MKNKQQQALHMYMNESCTQRQIAKELGVSERTIYAWIHGNEWDKLRIAAYAAPAMMAQNLCDQLLEMQNAIAAREPGQRFPTMQEATIQAKLINGIEKLKRYPSLSQNVQVLETFKRYVSPLANKEFNSRLNMFTELYVDVEAKNGFRPYEIEYGVDLTPLLVEDEGATERQQPEETGTSAAAAVPPSPQRANLFQDGAPAINNACNQQQPEVPRNTTSAAPVTNEAPKPLPCYPEGEDPAIPTNTLEEEWERVVLLVQAANTMHSEIRLQNKL